MDCLFFPTELCKAFELVKTEYGYSDDDTVVSGDIPKRHLRRSHSRSESTADKDKEVNFSFFCARGR